MRTFFLQIFLAFWISTVGIFFLATLLDPDGEFGSFENIHSFAVEDGINVSRAAVNNYRRDGCEGLHQMTGQYLLANREGQMLCGDGVSAPTALLIQTVLTGRRWRSIHDGAWWVTAMRIEVAGTTYVVVHQKAYARRPFFPHLPQVAFPVSLLVTFLFAFVLTRPVRALSKAFRRFSTGDLSVRLPVTRRRWSGLGGSDVRSLMHDFNYMADRISSLIAGQQILVRDISHELRSPLARLRLALEMAREETSQSTASFDRMEMEADRVNELISQMLTLSLMESTGKITDKSPVDIVELIDSLLPDLIFEAAARDCSVRFVQTGERFLISGNAELLRRAIENIARNSIRFTATASELLISVYTEEHTTEHGTRNRMIGIDIADRGPGVPEQSLDLLFRAFYRTDAARRDSTGGFGLGLSIAERAVLLHGGSMRATNREGGGLVISILLPEIDT